MAKRAINWTEIEARYKSGEKPVDIAKDYRDCTRQKISQKATRDSWTQSKQIIRNQVVQAVVEKTIENALLTRERLQQELLYMAYTDYAHYATVHKGGEVELKAFEEMPEGCTRAIKKIKEKRKIIETSGTEEKPSSEIVVESQLEYELYSKVDAIKILLAMEGHDKPLGEDPTKKQPPKFTLKIVPQSAAKPVVDEDDEAG